MIKKQRTARRLWLRFNVLAMAAAVTFSSLPRESHAGLKEAMNEMFVSTSTNPQMIETQRLRGFTGGSMTLKAPGKGISIVQFAAPRMDAGCGGIDIFFGSFSFINGAQFEQLVRSIAANAVGFAIKAAINGMCSPCGAIIEKLEEAIRELNAMAKNTCAIANQLQTSEGRNALMEQASNIGKRLKEVGGLVSDALAGENKRQSETPSATASGGSAANKDQNPMYGNLVYRAAQESLERGGNTLSAFLPQREAVELVMGLFGTVVIAKDKNSAVSCPAGTPAERCDQPPETRGASIAEWDQLFKPAKDGAGAGVKVWTCASADCTSINSGTIPIASWSGVDGFINLGLFGTLDPTVPSSYTSNSLVGAFIHRVPLSNATINPQARALLRISPVPIVSALMEVQKIKGGPELLGLQIAAMLPDFVSYQLGVEMMTIGHNVFSAQTATTMPESYARNLQMKAQSLAKMRPKNTDPSDIMIKAVESVKAMQMLTGSQFRAQGKD